LGQTAIKAAVFALSAALAGVAGALYGAHRGGVGPNDFVMLQSLSLLLLVTIGGINTVTGALMGGAMLTSFLILGPHFPALRSFQYLLTGLGAISLGRNPNGLSSQLYAGLAGFRDRLIAPRIRTEVDPIAATAS
jgi:branched-chain amino acid transport system permease protein